MCQFPIIMIFVGHWTWGSDKQQEAAYTICHYTSMTWLYRHRGCRSIFTQRSWKATGWTVVSLNKQLRKECSVSLPCQILTPVTQVEVSQCGPILRTPKRFRDCSSLAKKKKKTLNPFLQKGFLLQYHNEDIHIIQHIFSQRQVILRRILQLRIPLTSARRVVTASLSTAEGRESLHSTCYVSFNHQNDYKAGKLSQIDVAWWCACMQILLSFQYIIE